jgi:histidine ammonia-lyase
MHESRWEKMTPGEVVLIYHNSRTRFAVDIVAKVTTAVLKLKRIVENTRNTMAIEAMAAAQALDFLAPLKTSKRGQAAHAAIRSVCTTMDKDRVMYQDFVRIAELIASGKGRDALTGTHAFFPAAF